MHRALSEEATDASLAGMGFALVRGAVCSQIWRDAGRDPAAASSRGAGSRNLLATPWCRELAGVLVRHPAIARALPVRAAAVQCTFFDKSEEGNWGVGLHQDLAVPVREFIADPELRGWSEKEGHVFVQPPPSLLGTLLAVRLHLDDCDADNGPLRVVPGSHRCGRLSPEAARELRDRSGEIVCTARAGDALLMRPLLLHASSKATAPRRRRVLHFVFGPASPGFGLHWSRLSLELPGALASRCGVPSGPASATDGKNIGT